MSNGLMVVLSMALNVVLAGLPIVIIGTLLVRLARRLLLDGLPERREGGDGRRPSD